MKCAAQENVRDMRDLGCPRIIFIFKALEARGIRWRTLGTCNFICLAPWVPNPSFFPFIFRIYWQNIAKYFCSRDRGPALMHTLVFLDFPTWLGTLNFMFKNYFDFGSPTPLVSTTGGFFFTVAFTHIDAQALLHKTVSHTEAFTHKCSYTEIL